jgi:hypothetical protein
MIVREAVDAAATPKPTLAEMADACAAHAFAIESDECHLLLFGVRRTPRPDRVRQAAIFDALNRFLEACQTQPKEVARRLSGGRR